MTHRAVIRSSRNLELIYKLDRKIFPGDDPVKLDDSQWFVAHVKARPVGFAGITTEGFLSRCGVLPEYRGLGLQRRFIRRRIEWARSAGLESVWTYTSYDNAYSANNLIREHFEIFLQDDPDYEFISFRREL